MPARPLHSPSAASPAHEVVLVSPAAAAAGPAVAPPAAVAAAHVAAEAVVPAAAAVAAPVVVDGVGGGLTRVASVAASAVKRGKIYCSYHLVQHNTQVNFFAHHIYCVRLRCVVSYSAVNR